jgi:hypothetical protein
MRLQLSKSILTNIGQQIYVLKLDLEGAHLKSSWAADLASQSRYTVRRANHGTRYDKPKNNYAANCSSVIQLFKILNINWTFLKRFTLCNIWYNCFFSKSETLKPWMKIYTHLIAVFKRNFNAPRLFDFPIPCTPCSYCAVNKKKITHKQESQIYTSTLGSRPTSVIC